MLFFSRSVVSDPAAPWTGARQAPLSWDFPGENYGVGCIPFSRDLSNPGTEPSSFLPPAPELLLLCCSSLCQGRAQVGGTGHFLQAHKPEVTHSIIFKYCLILISNIIPQLKGNRICIISISLDHEKFALCFMSLYIF